MNINAKTCTSQMHDANAKGRDIFDFFDPTIYTESPVAGVQNECH